MRYRLFGRHTGLRVSEFVLGAGNFGNKWGYGSDAAEARRMFDGYLDAGGNFIDTADGYQFGESETLLGEFIPPRRDDIVIATKYSLGPDPNASVLATGNSRKNLVRAAEASLRRLRTDRIDLYWVHMPDGVTPVDDIMRGLDDLVRAGKVLYLGLSDFPAWRVARAATIAELRGLAPLAGLQIEYSLVQRTPDRDLLPMADAFGLGTVGWSPLGGGMLTGKYRKGETGRQTTFGRLFRAEDDAQKTAIVDTLEAVARETSSNPGRVALAWMASKRVLPILGPRTREQLDDNLAAIDLRLDADQIRRLDDVSAVALGFPHELVLDPSTRQRLSGGKFDLIDAPRVGVL